MINNEIRRLQAIGLSLSEQSPTKPCPPTAQYAISQAKIASKNIISIIRSRKKGNNKDNSKDVTKEQDIIENQEMKMTVFSYKPKGIMALIGKRNGVGIISGYKFHGFLAWWVWRCYYLTKLPSIQEKTGVVIDWIIDLLFKMEVTRLQTSKKVNFI